MKGTLIDLAYLFWDKRGPGLSLKNILGIILSVVFLLISLSIPLDETGILKSVLEVANVAAGWTIILSVASIFWGVRLGQLILFYTTVLVIVWRDQVGASGLLALVFDIPLVLLFGLIAAVYAEWLFRFWSQLARKILIQWIRPLKVTPKKTSIVFPVKKAVFGVLAFLLVLFVLDLRLGIIGLVLLFWLALYGWLLWQLETDSGRLNLAKVEDRLPIASLSEVRLGEDLIGEITDRGGKIWRMVLIEITTSAKAEPKTPQGRQRSLFDLLSALNGLQKIGAFSPFHLIRSVQALGGTSEGAESSNELALLVYQASEDTESALAKYALELNWRLTHFNKRAVAVYLQSIFRGKDLLDGLQGCQQADFSLAFHPHAFVLNNFVLETEAAGQKNFLGLIAVPAISGQALTSEVLDAAWVAAQRVGGRLHLCAIPYDRLFARTVIHAKRLARAFLGDKQKVRGLLAVEKTLLQNDPRQIRQGLWRVNVLVEIVSRDPKDLAKKLGQAQTALANQRIPSRLLTNYELEKGIATICPMGIENEDFDLRQWLVGCSLPVSDVLSAPLQDHLFDLLGAETRLLVERELPKDAGERDAVRRIEVGFLQGLGSQTFRPAFFDLVRELNGLMLIDGPLGSGKSALLGRTLVGILVGGYKGVVVDIEISQYFSELLKVFAAEYQRTYQVITPPKKEERGKNWEEQFLTKVRNTLLDPETIVVYQPVRGGLLTEDPAFRLFSEALLVFVNERAGDSDPLLILADEMDRLTIGEDLEPTEKRAARFWINIIDASRKHNVKLVFTTHSISDLTQIDIAGLGSRITSEAKHLWFLGANSETTDALRTFGFSSSLIAIIRNSADVSGLSAVLVDELRDRKLIDRQDGRPGDFIWVAGNEFIMGRIVLTDVEMEIKQREGLPVRQGGLPRLLGN